jgi:hypothetical protein
VKKFGVYRFLMLLAIVTGAGGCQCFKSTTFQAPAVVKPASACSTQSPALAKAELAYGQAIAREKHCDPSCVDYFFKPPQIPGMASSNNLNGKGRRRAGRPTSIAPL